MATNNSVNVGLSGATGTGNFVGANTPTLITPILGAATATSLAFSPTTGGIIGTTTNDTANSGDVGQIVKSIIAAASAVSLSNNSVANVTSISLTGGGDWDVWGNITFLSNTGTATYGIGWISSSSASSPDPSLYTQITGIGTNNNDGQVVPSQPFQLAGTTTIYLSAVAGFNTALSVCGGIYARRVR